MWTSSTTPGCTIALRASRSTCSISWQFFDQSMTIAVFVHSQARLVPPPRDRTGARCRAATRTATAAASGVRGTTTPIGTWR
ncbi:MAG TPA: hypothetical protein VEV65_02275 [Kineosporiaceae bacterium]|nr:hypothetical protein [Kineosporiaceae bacterium]